MGNNNNNDSSSSRKGKRKKNKNNNNRKRNSNTVEVDTSSLYWTRSLRTVIDSSWSNDISKRSSALQFKEQMQLEYNRLSLHSTPELTTVQCNSLCSTNMNMNM